MLTQKHFKAVAEIIKKEYTYFDDTGENDAEGKQTATSIAYRLADYFATQNPHFDRERFLVACGL